MGMARTLGALALAGTIGAFSITGAEAQQTQSRLYEVTKSKKLRVCQFPLYYSISFRNSKTGEIEGIDVGEVGEHTLELRGPALDLVGGDVEAGEVGHLGHLLLSDAMGHGPQPTRAGPE